MHHRKGERQICLTDKNPNNQHCKQASKPAYLCLPRACNRAIIYRSNKTTSWPFSPIEPNTNTMQLGFRRDDVQQQSDRSFKLEIDVIEQTTNALP
jgi:hypothetical protein